VVVYRVTVYSFIVLCFDSCLIVFRFYVFLCFAASA